jgi:hypothetical protein
MDKAPFNPMNQETASYIFKYFSHLLTLEERMVVRHVTTSFKLENASAISESRMKIFLEKGWLSKDQSVLDLLAEGYENFELKAAQRILDAHKDLVYFNNCPKCKKLARTPKAQQCRFCGHQWHSQT